MFNSTCFAEEDYQNELTIEEQIKINQENHEKASQEYYAEALKQMPPLLEDRLAQKISLDFKQIPASDVFKFLAMKYGFQLVENTDLSTPVTLVVQQVSVKDALAQICKSNNSICSFEKENFVVSKK